MAFPRTSILTALLPVLLFLFVPGPAGLAQEPGPAGEPARRPLVGLALSGGGARGFAHIGVLKALEEMGIPVDRIAGTSMGSVVGGLAACGYRASEIEDLILRQDWDDLFRNAAPRTRMALFERQEASRYLISLPMKGLRIQVPVGASEGDKITNILSLLTVTADGTRSFDDLPVPFRAVATDLSTGERVALGSGSLPEAIRASLAIPLLFTPVERDGRILVDGGLSDNLPADVAREMGAEVVIACDVTSPLRGKTGLNTPLGVADQALSIHIVASARKMREQADTVILPSLEGVTPADFRRAPEIIRAGYEAAMASAELRRMAGAPSTAGPSPKRDKPRLTIAAIRIEGTDRYSQKRLEQTVRSLQGREVGPQELQAQVDRILGDHYFEEMRFSRSTRPDGESVVTIQVAEKRSDGFNFSGRIDDKYGALGLVNLTFRDLGGGDNQASFDVQFGSFSRIGAEFLHPAVPGTAFFFQPQVFWSNDFQLGYSTRRDLSEYADRRWGGEIPAGNTFRNLGAVTLGYRFESVDFHRESGTEVFPSFQGQVASLILRTHLDTTDRADLPDRGRLVDFFFESARPGLGGDLEFDRARLDYTGFFTWHARHTLSTALRLGTSFADELPVFEQYRLGGEDFLFGRKREEVRGNHVAGVRAGYRYLLADFEGAFFSRIYIEGGVDGANAWVDREHLGGGLIPDGYLSLQIRSWLGPIRLNLGFAEGGERNATLSIGHQF